MDNIEISIDEPNVVITDEYSGDYNLPIASATTLGVVKIGANISETSDGTISVPIASADTAGVIKVGSNLSIDENGVLSGQAGGSVTVDSTLSTVSTNPVRNKVITSEINSTNNTVSTIQSSISGINTSIGNLAEALGTTNTNVTTNANNISALQTAVQTNIDNISTNAGNIATNTSNITALDTRLDTDEGYITAQGNAVGQLQDNFNRVIISTYNAKKLAIYGDSISTFVGYVPAGNAVYYDGTRCDVTDVEQTWWMKVINTLQMELAVNNSWSGRAVSSCRDSDPAHTTDAGYKQANIDVLGSNGTPDVIIIKLGINDFNYGAYLGTYDGSAVLPSTVATFTDAYAVMLDRIMTTYPNAEIYCCTLMDCERNGGTAFPEISQHDESLVEWNEALKKLALAFGCKILDHAVAGITHYNLTTYCGDYDPDTHHALHPNPNGMSLIANETIHEMDNAMRTRYGSI